jgi:hypothetical protein
MLITGKEKRALSNVNGYLMSAKMELAMWERENAFRLRFLNELEETTSKGVFGIL